MRIDENSTVDWTAVIGRSVAYLCLAQAGLRDKDLATQGHFLEKLGLPRKDAAELLGTSQKSLTELFRQAGKNRGGNRASSKKKKRKR